MASLLRRSNYAQRSAPDELSMAEKRNRVLVVQGTGWGKSAGINTGIIRSMAGSGSVVTAAGLVFAFTMASFVQRPDGARSDRNDDRAGSAVRHADRAIVHDTVDRGVARTVVLVAGASAPAASAAEVRRRGHAPPFAVLADRADACVADR